MTASPPMSRPRPRRNYLDPLDLEVTVREKDGKRTVKWEPSFRFIDTKTVTPDPDTAEDRRRAQGQARQEPQCRDRHDRDPLDSRRNVVRSQEAAIGDLIADAMRGANRRRHRHHQRRRHPRRQAVCRRHGADPARHPDRAAVRQRHGGDRDHRPADPGGAGERLQPGRGRRRPLPAGLGPEDGRRPQAADGQPRRVGDGRRQAARPGGHLQGRHQRLHARAAATAIPRWPAARC